MHDSATLAGWVSRLVRVPSVNPLHAGERAGAPGEKAMAEALAGYFEDLGATAQLDEVLPERPNVYGVVPGRTERLVCLDVHTDTVSVEHMVGDPFDGRVEDGRVWGRGALDTKASMGVALALLDTWRREGQRPEPTVLLVGSISEEAGGMPGAEVFRAYAEAEGLAIDEMVVAEPTRCRPVYGHKGGVSLELAIVGEAAHTATPHLGRNAISAAARVIAALEVEHERLQALTPATEVGNGTLTVTMIAGGTGGNVVPALCTLCVGRRIVPFEDNLAVIDELSALAREASPLPVEVTVSHMGSGAFYQSPDSPFVEALARWAGTSPAVAPYGTHALKYGGLAAGLAVFGPGAIEDAHRATESVAVAELQQLADVYAAWW
ncbi:MAG: M20/M25/M40 family metallo-hydrolase, partial [Acidimicrobiia bacterium]|nr:M20/M25/M40 family metallo-hydrolase [Acidimicrobiia bacterium]